MRRAWLAPVLLLVACEDEPDFDERYEQAQEQIMERYDELGDELEAPSEPANESTGPAGS